MDHGVVKYYDKLNFYNYIRHDTTEYENKSSQKTKDASVTIRNAEIILLSHLINKLQR